MSKIWDSYIPEVIEDRPEIKDGLLGSTEYGDRGKFNTCLDCGAIIHRWGHKRCNPCATELKKKRARAKEQALWIVRCWEERKANG